MPKAKPGKSRTGKNRISKSTTTDGSEQSSTKMEEKRNNRESDSAENQSDSTGDISSNSDDSATDDSSDDDKCSINEDIPVHIKFDSERIKKTLKSKLSIFKLANNRLAGVEKIKDDIKEFEKCIKVKLNKNGIHYKGGNGDICKPYHLMHFFYCTKKKENVVAEQIGEHLEYPEGIGDCPGDRQSGNILVFYRLKQNVPEAFFLCQGFGYRCILYLCDPSFRTRVVKRFMDGEKIKEIETLTIAGSDIASTIIYRDNCNIAAVSFLERAIVKLTGIIVRNSKLDKLIQRGGSKAILMTVGINFVRIGKHLQWKEWTKVLELFSDEEMEVEGPNCHIRDALEYVRRVEDDKKSRELDKTITAKAIDIIANNKPTSSYYLSHRYTRNWLLSSNVILKKEQPTSRSRENITSWSSAPTFIMVIEAINRHFTQSPSSIREQLRNRKIILSYDSEKGMQNIPVQDYVHGSVSQDGGQYYKIAQKWFFLSSTYSQVVDRNFAYIYQCMLVDKRISDLIYPWRHQKLEITNVDCENFLRVSHDAGQQILQKLTQECELVDEANHCCLTGNSYLLPESSELYKELKGKEGKNKKTRKKTTREAMNNSLGNNTQHQDSGIGLASSVDSSATVGSITDTQSSSLNMSLPSTSNLTLGSGLNTPEVDNDIDQNQTSTSDDVTSGQNKGVGQMLYQVLTSDRQINDSGVLSVLQNRNRKICVQEDNKYFVCNPILTPNMMEQIKHIQPSLEEPRLSLFLRCMSSLSEGDYNALYLNCDENDNFIIFPGDKVLANNVELFDILVYDKENHTTYLFHNKEGLDHHTRDACAQIRNSSELLWHDFMRGQRNHIEEFWKSAVNSKTAMTPYRYFLQRKLTELGKDMFMKMFDSDVKIVFVLGFVISQSKASPKLQWKFKPLTLNDFQEEDLKEDDKTWLKTEGILTESGYLTDCFNGMTQGKFVEKFKLRDRNIKTLKKIYKFLRTKGTCDLSTIAKLELLTLDKCFSRYQIGGKRHYHLKALQLDSK